MTPDTLVNIGVYVGYICVAVAIYGIYRIRKIGKEEDEQEVPHEYIKIPPFHINKHFDDMTRKERRLYLKYLQRHDMWDASVFWWFNEKEKERQIRIENKKNSDK